MQKKEIKETGGGTFPRVIGITGGVGSGKSRILELLSQEYGAQVILADEVARELQKPGRPGLAGLISAFGEDILSLDGSLDRGRFATLIFQDPAARDLANEIIHPLAWQEIRRQIAESPAPLVAVESALFDEDTRFICQELWFVDTKEEVRIRRLMENRGYSREKCLEIIRSQKSREDYLRLADAVIPNDGPMEEVRARIAVLLGGQKQTEDKGAAE